MRSLLIAILLIAAFSLSALGQKPDSSNPTDAKPSATPKLPEASVVVEKYVKAIGGSEPLKKQKTRYQAATVELAPMGIKGTVETFARSDDRLLVKTTLGGLGEILVGYDGQKAWTVNPIQGNRVQEGKELLQTKRTAMFAREISFDRLYNAMRVRSIEPVGDRKSYVIVASADGLPDDVLYFDTETGLMLRSDSITVTPEGEQTITTFFEDYREVDGTKSPFKIRAKTPAFEINTVITEIKYNVPIEDTKFIQPK